MTLNPVSYTHLDVYKRQIDVSTIPAQAINRAHVGVSAFNVTEKILIKNKTVCGLERVEQVARLRGKTKEEILG